MPLQTVSAAAGQIKALQSMAKIGDPKAFRAK
jgi:hypothetical protein